MENINNEIKTLGFFRCIEADVLQIGEIFFGKQNFHFLQFSYSLLNIKYL